MPRVKATKTNPSESPKRIIVSQTSACGGDVSNNNTRDSIIRKKNRKLRPGSVALRDIQRYQRTTEPLIPLAPMDRLVRETMQNRFGKNHRYRLHVGAVHAIREAVEKYLTDHFKNANMCASHARRILLTPRDMSLAYRLSNDISNYGGGRYNFPGALKEEQEYQASRKLKPRKLKNQKSNLKK